MRARQRAFRLPPAFDRSPAIEKPKAPTPVPGHHLVCLALAASVLLNVALLRSGTGAEPRAPPQAGGGVRGHGSFAPAAAAADQLAGLDDGADDDPLLPLALTWRNFKATLAASLEAIAVGFRWRR